MVGLVSKLRVERGGPAKPGTFGAARTRTDVRVRKDARVWRLSFIVVVSRVGILVKVAEGGVQRILCLWVLCR